ncbi:MAG: hypothetical protein E7384_08075 [Ruminococcaceae bacterium]|nr:hypothetical protein [Oscillospiraceae bacterium]
MKLFAFDHAVKGNYLIDENGFTFRAKVNKAGFFVLNTPIQKEVTNSKGMAIQYAKHSVAGFGYLDGKDNFRGVAIFDINICAIIVLLITFGVGYASSDIFAGVFWGFLTYLLISFLYSSDDDGLLCKAKHFIEAPDLNNLG